MALAGFEPTIPANERPQTHTLDRASGLSRRLKYVVGIKHLYLW